MFENNINFTEKAKEMAQEIIYTLTPEQKKAFRELIDYLRGQMQDEA